MTDDEKYFKKDHYNGMKCIYMCEKYKISKLSYFRILKKLTNHK